MAICIISRCYSNRIICVTTIIYCYCFTSCIFNSIFRNGYFVLSTRIIYIFTACNRNISNVSIASCISFFNYTFSGSCTSSVSNRYFINCFIRISCIRSYCYITRTRSYFNGMVQFSFCSIGQVSYYICTRSSCFDIFTAVSTNYTEAQTTSLT